MWQYQTKQFCTRVILHTLTKSFYTRAIFFSLAPCVSSNVKPNQIYKCSKSSQSIKWKNYYISTIITMICNAYHNQTRDMMAYMTSCCLHLKYLHLNGGAEVAPCRLCKLDYSINMFCVAIPNQINLHTCYSSHCNSMWKCQTKPHNLQKYTVP